MGSRGGCSSGERGSNRLRVLYISYDGLLEPVGQSQVLPYLERLSGQGVEFTLLTFEKPQDMKTGSITFERTRERIAAAGIRWVSLRYHRWPAPIAKPFDLLVGMARAMTLVVKHRVGVIHCRSYVAALIGWALQRLLGVRFLFDMRGFWADERVEGGLWPPGGFLYRITKRMERRFLTDADEIVTLTERARLSVECWPGVQVRRVSAIPTCVDLEKFSPPTGPRADDNFPVWIYAGSVGTWYLLEEMLRFVEQAISRFPHTHFLLLTRNREEVTLELKRARLPPRAVTVAFVSPAEVPAWLARSHAGLAFYKPGLARQATCPTKIGEYLAMGLPVVVNDAVGDMNEVVGKNRVGVVLSEFSGTAYQRSLDTMKELWEDPTLASRCRRVAETYFSLQTGVDRYWAIYQRLAA